MTEEQERRAFEAHMRSLNATTHFGRQSCAVGGEYRTITVERAWNLWQARASLAKPQPVGGADTLRDALVSLLASYGRLKPPGYPKSDAEKQAEAALATLSAPVAQPGEAVSYEQIDELLADHAKGSREMHDFARNVLALAATPIAAQPAAAEPMAEPVYSTELNDYRRRNPVTPEAAAVPEAVERDAARYQWLRASYTPPKDGLYEFDGIDLAIEYGGAAMDEAIDAAIDRLAAPEAGAGGGKP